MSEEEGPAAAYACASKRLMTRMRTLRPRREQRQSSAGDGRLTARVHGQGGETQGACTGAAERRSHERQ